MPFSYMPVNVSSGHLDELAVLELQRLEQHAHPHFLHPLFLIAVSICHQVSTPLLDSVPMLCDQTRHSFHTADNRSLLKEGISVWSARRVARPLQMTQLVLFSVFLTVGNHD